MTDKIFADLRFSFDEHDSSGKGFYGALIDDEEWLLEASPLFSTAMELVEWAKSRGATDCIIGSR